MLTCAAYGPQTQNYFNKNFKHAIVASHVGYIGGHKANPTYREVCTGTTGHAEALQVRTLVQHPHAWRAPRRHSRTGARQIEYDPSKVSYADLVTLHFRIHDPTTLNRQGNDVGTQYRSAIFYHTPEQARIATEVRDQLQATRIQGKIVTEIVPAATFYKAEDYHQLYLEANPGGYCNHRYRW
jgi:peptide-methionine (S)-S-oxide reductase